MGKSSFCGWVSGLEGKRRVVSSDLKVGVQLGAHRPATRCWWWQWRWRRARFVSLSAAIIYSNPSQRDFFPSSSCVFQSLSTFPFFLFYPLRWPFVLFHFVPQYIPPPPLTLSQRPFEFSLKIPCGDALPWNNSGWQLDVPYFIIDHAYFPPFSFTLFFNPSRYEMFLPFTIPT